MYIKGKNRGGHISKLPPHPKKHHKPYRIRHLGLFAAGVAAIVLSAFGIGYQLGNSATLTVFTGDSPGESAPAKPASGFIRSGLGLYLKYDPLVFSAEARTEAGQEVTGNKLQQGLNLSKVTFKPKNSSVEARDALSGLEIDQDSDSATFERFRQNSGYSGQNEALAHYFAPESDRYFSVEETSRSSESMGSVRFQKTIYKQTPKFDAQAKPIFSIVWSGIYSGKPVRLYLKNLLSDHIPSVYGSLLAGLHFGGTEKVLSESVDRQAFNVNKVSPAVVKIYRFVCGTLVINDTKYGNDACDGGSGSGFLVSSDGYIATSGHVVVLDAADILVNQLLSDPALLQQFTAASGLTAQQSARSDVVVSMLAKIYDLPAQKLRLDNRREAVFVSLGNRPLDVDNQQKAKQVFSKKDTDYIKRAKIIAVNYQPKDLLTIEQQDQDGFSASDVALIKADLNDAPYIDLADSRKLAQNSPVSLIGFPADADNQLTENSVISPSVTNGTINSIRQANGSSSLLFQTDADASEGSSGGPAIDGEGKVFGLVTYRFKSANETDAAKSYIRDIADFKELAISQNLALNTDGKTQRAWEVGLDLFSSQRYSKALVQFHQVRQSYPAHRLVADYIAQAQQGIKDGKDKKDPPYAVIVLTIAGTTGMMAAVAAAVLIIRHRRAHLVYKAVHSNAQQVVSPSA